MQHTFSSLGCPELDLDGVIALAARHGFHALELRTLGSSTDLPAWFTEHYETPAKLAEHLQMRRVRVCALNTSFKIIGHDDIDRAMLENYVKWADETGVEWLRVFDGGKTGDDAEIKEAAETLEWWRELRLKNGWAVDLMVETHDSLVSSATLAKFLAAAPSASLLWDSHHTWRKGGEDPLATWEVVKGRTVHIHVKDSIGEPSAHHPYTYVLPGDGEFPMKALRTKLKEDHYAGVLSLEWEKMWHPYLPPVEKALHVAARRGWW